MLVVLEYLALTSREKPVTKYHIMTHISELKQQRQDRISQFVDTLEKNGFITLIDTANAKFYYITENGLMEYNRWVRNFLAFFRGINNLDYNEEDNIIKNFVQTDIFISYLVEEFTDAFSTSIIFLINLSEDRPTKSKILLSTSGDINSDRPTLLPVCDTY